MNTRRLRRLVQVALLASERCGTQTVGVTGVLTTPVTE
jgi:hypothetical protein